MYYSCRAKKICKKLADTKKMCNFVAVFFEHNFFYCSMFLPNCDLERDFTSKIYTLLKLHHKCRLPIMYRGRRKPGRNMAGLRFFMAVSC